jgi:hypothetical protein
MTMSPITADTDAGDLETAQAVLALLEAAAEASSTEVDRARERHALGELSRGDLQKLQRRLGRAIDALEDGRAKVRAFQRREAEARAAATAARQAVTQSAYQDCRERRAVVLAHVVERLADIDRQVVDLDAMIRTFNTVATADGAGGLVLTRPSDMGRVWGPTLDGIRTLFRLYGDLAR